MDFLARNVGLFRRALDDHNGDCPIPATGFLLSAADYELLCTTTLWGLEIIPDERVPVGRVRILCGGSAWGIEAELESYVAYEQADRIIDPGAFGAHTGAHAPNRQQLLPVTAMCHI